MCMALVVCPFKLYCINQPYFNVLQVFSQQVDHSAKYLNVTKAVQVLENAM